MVANTYFTGHVLHSILVIPGVIWSIVRKEEMRHFTIAFVEKCKVVCFHHILQHQDQSGMFNHTEPKRGCFTKVALPYFLFIDGILLENVKYIRLAQSLV